MTTFRFSLPVIAFAAIAASSDARADVYKCIDADDNISYSQTPCPNQLTTSVSTSSNNLSNDALECQHAGQFALTIASSMKRGIGSADVFDRYGGIRELSKSAVNVINYVYVFQHSKDVTTKRIAELAKNKCKARAFGAVTCEAMPLAYVHQIGGCEADRRQPESVEPNIADSGPSAEHVAPAPQVSQPAESNTRTQRARSQRRLSRAEDVGEECRERVRSEIDGINARMRSGYSAAQGERYRSRLRKLRDQKNDC